MEIKKHLDKLGYKVKDKVTGFEGVLTSIGFDLYGCVQCIVTPPMNKEGKTEESKWFDIVRLELTSKKPVMDVPDFTFDYGDKHTVAQGKKGCDFKSIPKN